MAQPELQVTIHGHVPPDFWEGLRAELRDCYRRLPSDLRVVQVHLLDTVERLREFLARERAELGIAIASGEEFLATHDAWRGVPRITICQERIESVPPLVGLGAIRHEVAHTILHGSLEYFVFRLSRDLVSRGRERGLDDLALQQLLYHVAIAVKDCEAARLLVEHGYAECQVALALYQMEVSDEDRLAWLLARSDPGARLICLAAQLKPLLFARPLLGLAAFSRPLEERIRAMLAFLPAEEGEKLTTLAERVASSLGDDTRQNIELALWSVLTML